jgi:hypothetical protein
MAARVCGVAQPPRGACGSAWLAHRGAWAVGRGAWAWQARGAGGGGGRAHAYGFIRLYLLRRFAPLSRLTSWNHPPSKGCERACRVVCRV